MKLRAGLHPAFAREILAEIPTALLAITSLRVTSYPKKRGVGVRSGRCGWLAGEGSVKCKKEKGEKEKESKCAALCNRLSQANFP